MNCLMAQWVALSLWSYGCSPRVPVGFHWVLWFPPTSEKHSSRRVGVSKCSSMWTSCWMYVDNLWTCVPLQVVFLPHSQFSWDKLPDPPQPWPALSAYWRWMRSWFPLILWNATKYFLERVSCFCCSLLHKSSFPEHMPGSEKLSGWDSGPIFGERDRSSGSLQQETVFV